MTLTALALGRMTLMKQAATVLGGTMVLALASQVSVPFYPVPMTLQTLAVLAIGFAFGPRLAAITVALWLAQAAMGAPVLSNFGNGIRFFGPTAGFLVGFVGMAYLAGLAADRGLLAKIGMGVLASAALYIPGLAWPLGVAEMAGLQVWGHDLGFAALLDAFAVPFLLGDAVKAVLAAVLVTGGMTALRKRG
ncbi:biotin transporter BioY [Jannaschia donghaensis]|uniref:Biotin transporter n=1 Tax=Jannaschia donghaensis TaxID=420998 RepID=A0A0M6YMK4_9RHOB|nr:biotin transporter BioY [Jannaschia donghaensis]CTQ50885.1 Biotin ECF transporter S component BioY [Jannaschia donghaensis]